jgi:hypothetical protein
MTQFDMEIADLKMQAARAVWERTVGQLARADIRMEPRLIRAAESREAAAVKQLIAAEVSAQEVRGLVPAADWTILRRLGSALG